MSARGAGAGPDGAPSRRALLPALGALSAFGPISMDVYLPALPALGRDLSAGDAVVQVTLSACLIGLALGQLLWGPISDRYGRRVPMLWAIAGFALASIACAAAPTVGALIAARLLQGVCGSAGMAIGRAVVHDVYEGSAAIGAYATLMAISGVAPVLAPLLGGALLTVTDWRGVFVALAAIGVALLLTAALCVPETLPRAERTTGGLGSDLRGLAAALSNGPFMVFAVTLSLTTCGFFTYLQMSSFVLQDEFGIDAQGFALVFAVNAVGIVLGTRLSRRLAAHGHGRRLVVWTLSIGTIAAAALLLSALLHAALPWLLAPLFLLVAAHGVNNPTLTGLSLARIAHGAGSASAVLGTLAALLGALVPPLLSGNGVSAVPMASTMLVATAAALVVLATAGRRAART